MSHQAPDPQRDRLLESVVASAARRTACSYCGGRARVTSHFGSRPCPVCCRPPALASGARQQQEPFPADDPMLPAQDAPVGRCDVCGDEHRLDLGCPFEVREVMKRAAVVAFLVLAVGTAILVLVAWAWWRWG